VGNGAYGLYRPGADTAVLQTSDTSANFRLAGSMAQLAVQEGLEVNPKRVAVDGGTLSVDFSRATFATQLNVSHPAIGAQSLQANGVVQRNGMMVHQGGNAFVAGALSLDGKEAGYFFEKPFSAGNLTGITVWGR
jgi:hypothetical protein